jgi:hypothetical protein
MGSALGEGKEAGKQGEEAARLPVLGMFHRLLRRATARRARHTRAGRGIVFCDDEAGIECNIPERAPGVPAFPCSGCSIAQAQGYGGQAREATRGGW